MALREQLDSQGRSLFKYRGHLPIVFLLIGLAVFIYQDFHHGKAGHFWNDPFAFICLAVCFIGFIIRVITVGHTPTNTSGKNTEEHMADELNTTGMYAISRNPLYLGNFFMWLGVALLTQSFWFVIAFIFFYWIYYERIIYSEEEFLRKSYGESYLSWANKTPIFIPNFSKWTKPSWTFSWKKVLKKEKNSFAAIFIVFYLFKLSSDFLHTHPFQFTFDKWFYMFSGGLLTYIILKTIRRTTGLFDEYGR